MLFLHKITEDEIFTESLSESVLERVNNKTKKADKAQSLSAYRCINKLLSLMNIVDEVVLKENGKPILQSGEAFISASHSKGFVLCGISKFPIGVDVEKMRKIDLKVARRFCSEKELENCKNEQDFFKIWTLKEAYFKLYGNVSDIKEIEFTFSADRVCCSDEKIKAKSFFKNDLAIAVCEKIIP